MQRGGGRVASALMFVARKLAVKVLPLVVVGWATLAIVGGAVNLAKQAEADQGSAVKAGLGLCAVSVALLVGKRVRRLVPPAPMGLLGPAYAPPFSSRPRVLRGPPPKGPPIFLLFRVSRT